MTKIIILIALFLVILSLHIKNKKFKIFRNIFYFISVLMLFTSFSNNVFISYKIEYLYGQADFEKYAEYAKDSFRENGVFASLTLAQAAVEQNFKPLANNNMFGIKGKCGVDAEYATKECDSSGNCYNTTACFRTYASIKDSFVDHGNFLIYQFGNRNEFNKATTLKEQMISLKSNPVAQYGTDPSYLCVLSSIIRKYDLTKYDEGITYTGRGVTIKGEHIDNFTIDNCYYVNGVFTSSPNSSNSTNNSNIYINYNPKTTYEGTYKDGYLFERFKNDTNDYELLSSKLDSGEADKIISEIYGRVVDGLNYHNNLTNGNLIGSIGNIGTIGSIDAGPYSTWRQSDSRWGSIKIGTTSKTISGVGCAVTSVAIQIARSGVELASSFKGNFNPGSFVLAMNSIGGFTGASIWWAKPTTIAPNFKFHNIVSVNRNNALSTIASYLQDSNNYLVAHVYGSIGRDTSNHWVAVTGVTDNDVYMIDPASSSNSLNTTYGIKYIDSIVIYKVS